MNHCLCNNNSSKWGSKPSADNPLEKDKPYVASSNEHWLTQSKWIKKAGQTQKVHLGENPGSGDRQNTSGSVNTLNLVPAREHDSWIHLQDFASFSLLHSNPLYHLPQGATVRGPIQKATPSPFSQSLQLSSSLFRKQSPVKWEALLISALRLGAPFAWQSAV